MRACAMALLTVLIACSGARTGSSPQNSTDAASPVPRAGTLLICVAIIAYFLLPQAWPHELLLGAGGLGLLAWWRRLCAVQARREAWANAELLADAIYRRQQRDS